MPSDREAKGEGDVDVTVVVPAHDAVATVGRAVGCLLSQRDAPSFEVILVDDGSTDGTAEMARRAAGADARLRIIFGGRRGAGAARNLGVSCARGPIIAFTDADCFPTPEWLAAGVDALNAADIVQGAVQPDPDARRAPFQRTLWVDHETGLFETANLLLRRELVHRVGGFSTAVSRTGRPAAGEDVVFGWRARRAGARVTFDPSALVHHAVFRGGVRAQVEEAKRVGTFPAVVAEIPELRVTFLFRHLFLSRRRAEFDLALAGIVLAAACRSRVPLLTGMPYALRVIRHAFAWGRWAPMVIVVGPLCDSVATVALLRGSLRHRTLIL